MECPRCRRYISPETRRCKWCRTAIPVSQHLLEECGVVPPSRPRPPAPSRDTRARDTRSRDTTRSLILAPLGDRCVAVLLDSFVLIEITGICSFWLFLHWGRRGEGSLELTAAALFAASVLALLIFFVYTWFFEAVFGATLGKAIVGIAVYNQSQRKDLTASAIRNALRLIDGIGFYLVGTLVASCSTMRRRLGDICADTLVVAKEFHAATKALAMSLWVVLLAATIWFAPRIAADSTPGQPPPYLNQTVVQIGRSANNFFVRVASVRVEVQLGSAPGAGSAALSQLPADGSTLR